ncbi:MAG: FmdB family transcriptional regulator [Actinomycetota bacterium]|nr:FmdB family transcriptional regulator [Actinomycetota bacterium]
MPTYEYACRSCGSHLEVVQAFSDEALTECTACGGPLRKVFGTIGISFKGSGFYKTDSRSSAKGGSEARRDKDGASETSEKSGKAEKSETPAKADKPAASDKGGSGSKGDSAKAKSTTKESTAAKSA